ncbi:metal-dependent transcriptional regulator, partial [Schaalia turicensis]
LVRIVDIDQAGQVSLEIGHATAPIVGAGRSARLAGDVASIVMVSPLEN